MTEPVIYPGANDDRHACPIYLRLSLETPKGSAPKKEKPCKSLSSPPSSLQLSLQLSIPADPEPSSESPGFLSTPTPTPTRTIPALATRTPLARKTPLKAKKPMARKSARKASKVGKVPVKAKRGAVVDACDRHFRRLMKLQWDNGVGYCECFTCFQVYGMSYIEVGHYHSRRFMGIRWDERNVRPQCHRCNQDQEGASGAEMAKMIKATYTARLTNEIGEDGMADLESHKHDKTPTYQLEALRDILAARVKGKEARI